MDSRKKSPNGAKSKEDTMKKIISLCFILCLLVPVALYAQDEAKLTEKEAQAELAALQEQLATANAKISSLESQLASLKTEVSALANKRDELRAKLEELKTTWKTCQYGRYTVVEGDWLSKIAGLRNVYNDGKKWPMIYEANKEKVKNPDVIYPSWVLLIPYLDNYTVVSGDYLSLVASYLSIYSNSKRWPEIYEANKDKVKDPDLIYPKQDLVIPHN
jgi:nucleoid-associated protein YgaU